MINLIRKAYWVFHMKWKGSNKAKHIYAFFVIACFSGCVILYTLFIPIIGFGIEVLMSKKVYMALILAITGSLLTYFICVKNDGYKVGEEYFLRFSDKDITKSKNRIIYKFALLCISFMAVVGITGFVLADMAGLIKW